MFSHFSRFSSPCRNHVLICYRCRNRSLWIDPYYSVAKLTLVLPMLFMTDCKVSSVLSLLHPNLSLANLRDELRFCTNTSQLIFLYETSMKSFKYRIGLHDDEIDTNDSEKHGKGYSVRSSMFGLAHEKTSCESSITGFMYASTIASFGNPVDSSTWRSLDLIFVSDGAFFCFWATSHHFLYKIWQLVFNNKILMIKKMYCLGSTVILQ